MCWLFQLLICGRRRRLYDARGELYFRLRHLFETRHYGQLNKAKLDRLRDLSQRFQHSAAESRFKQWAKSVETKTRLVRVDAHFEAYRLPHSYDIFGTHPGPKSDA